MSASVRLSVSDTTAQLVSDPLGGTILMIDGREQSHVDLADPTAIRHEYLRRIAHLVDTAAPAGEPISVLHLGAGALTLARYVQAVRPGSEQTVVELERELVTFVLDALPLPAGTRLAAITGDAREAVLGMGSARFDLIVLDVFSGADSPAHLACEEFSALCLGRLTDRGVLAVNIGDDEGLRFWAGQALDLADAADAAGAPGVWTLADAALVRDLAEGNLVLAAGPGVSTEVCDDDELEDVVESWMRGGPHPATVLDPDETEELAERIAATSPPRSAA